MGMSRKWWVILLACGLGKATAQPIAMSPDSLVDLDQRLGQFLGASGDFDYNANTLSNAFPLAIRNGGFIDRETRQRALDQLSGNRNAAGYVLQAQLQWVGPRCTSALKGWRPLVQLAYHELGGLQFTRDQFAITFFGNASYEGKKAILSPSAFTQIRYQTLGAGLQHARSKSFFRVDLVRGQSYSEVDIRNASLFTGEDGRVLRTAILGDYFASDTAGSGLDRTNGLGMAVSGRWNTELVIGPKQIAVGVWLDDLGVVAWNDNSVSIQKDTLFNYTGWQADNLFALDDVLIGEEQILDTFGLRYRKGPLTRLLPFRAGIEASMAVGRAWHLGFALDHRVLPGYIPQLTAQASRRFGRSTQLGGTVSYGGFGALRVGLAVKQRIGKQVLFTLSTPQVPAFVTDEARGLGLAFGVTVGF